MRRDPMQDGASRYTADRSMRWGWPVLFALAGGVAFGVSAMAARVPALVETWYSGGIWPVLSRPLSVVSGLVPFSLAEALLVVYAIWLLVMVGQALLDVLRRRRQVRNALAGGVRLLLLHGGLGLAFFYAVWGLNYSRPSFEVRAGWPAWDGIETVELIDLAQQSVAAANEAYFALHGVADLGEPTGPPSDGVALDRSLDEGWRRAADQLGMDPVVGRHFGPAKRPFTSGLIAYLGISGVYVPFTGEATVVGGLPWMRAPLSMAHEKAHQRGVTTEAEATFLGFVASSLAPDSLARYAAAVHAMSQLLSAVRRPDREEWQRLSQTIHPGIGRDLRDFSEYISRHEGVPDRVQTAVNDRYLRVNRVPGGVQSYSLSARLLVELARQQGGRLMPSEG